MEYWGTGMEIYVVKAGDTLYEIARRYNRKPMELAWVNQIDPPDSLAVGQALLIPGNTNYENQNAWNAQNMRNTQNTQNMQNRYQALIFGFAYPYIQPDVLMETLPYLTDLLIFSYHFTEDGNLVPPFADDVPLIQAAKRQQVRPIFTLTSIGENGRFEPGLTEKMLANPQAQQRLIENIRTVMQQKGYEGINVDMESVLKKDAEPLAAFVEKLARAMHEMGWMLSVDVAPKVRSDQPGLLYEGIDYSLLGKAADLVFLMTYEWGHSASPPMAVAPINLVRRVVDYAVTEIPREKLLLGIPNYGYDWTLPFVVGGARARSIGNVEAVQIAAYYHAEIQFDELAQSPYFYYRRDGAAHQVWFEDVRSMQAKFMLVQEYGLVGFGYWQIMRLFRANWILSQYYFQRKLG